MIDLKKTKKINPLWYISIPFEIWLEIFKYAPNNTFYMASTDIYTKFASSVKSLKFSPTTSRLGYLNIPRIMKQLDILLDFAPPVDQFSTFCAKYININSLDLSGVKEVEVIIACLQHLANLTSLNLANTLDLYDLSEEELTKFFSLLWKKTTLTTLNIKSIGCQSDSIQEELIKSQIEHITSLTTLTKLNISNWSTEQNIDFSKLTNLATLEINNCRSIQAANISSLTSLTYLDAKESLFEDLFHLSNLQQLSYLNIPIQENKDMEEENNNVGFLSSLTNLTSLNLARRRIGENLLPLSNLTNLHTLDLSYLTIETEENLLPLSNLTNLHTLDLSYLTIETEYIPYSAINLPSTLITLNKLILAQNQPWCNPITMPMISHLPNINTLDIRIIGYTNLYQGIYSLVNITELYLRYIRFTEEDRNIFSTLTNIETLTIADCTDSNNNITNITALTNLKYLSLKNLDHDDGVDFIYTITSNITSLNLVSLSKTTTHLISLGRFSCLTNLNTLKLSKCEVEDWEILSFELTNVQKLQLPKIDAPIPKLVTKLRCYGKTDLSFITSLENLKRLNIDYRNLNRNATDDNISLLSSVSNLPHITIFHYNEHPLNRVDLKWFSYLLENELEVRKILPPYHSAVFIMEHLKRN